MADFVAWAMLALWIREVLRARALHEQLRAADRRLARRDLLMAQVVAGLHRLVLDRAAHVGAEDDPAIRAAAAALDELHDDVTGPH